jgi:hypothetical protein
VRIGRDVNDAITLPDAERLERRRPAIASFEELLVRKALVAVDDGLTRGVQAACPPCELQGR